MIFLIIILSPLAAYVLYFIYAFIRYGIDKGYRERTLKFIEEQKEKEKAKLEEKRQKWLRNEYEIFRAGQRMGTIPSDMTFQDWLR